MFLIFLGFQYIYKAVQPSSLSNSRTLLSSPKESLSILAVTLICPSSSPCQLLICFLSLYLPIQDIPYNWSHIVSSLLWVAPFTLHIFKVHPCRSVYQYFIPFYTYIIFYCLYILHFVYPLINQWTFWFFPHFDTSWFLTLKFHTMSHLLKYYFSAMFI